jgi:MFS family permease
MPELTLYQRGIHARNAVWASFFLLGVAGMAWVPRIPEIKDSLGLSDGEFGLLLLASTAGAIPGAQLAGRVVHMYSSQLVIRISGVLLPIGVFVMGYSTTVEVLALGLLIMGFSVPFMDVALNGQAVEIERHTKGRWMSSFHGLWSVGAFSTTLFGGTISHVLTPRENLFLLSIISLFAYFFVTRYLLPPEFDGHLGDAGTITESKIPLFGKQSMILWALGIGLICALIPEGGAFDWSGILLKDHMGISKGLTASAATSFSLAMIVSRLLGDRFFEKWGHVKTVKYGGLFGGSLWGLSLAIGIPISSSHEMLGLFVVCIGFAAAGFGIGPFFPAFYLAAASVPGVAPSVGLARVGLIAFAAYFAGPTMMGAIAEVATLPIAFIFPVLLFFVVALQSRYIKVRDIHSVS